jgi:hypothetical protein
LKRDALLQKGHLVRLAVQPLGIREQSVEIKNQRADGHWQLLHGNFTGIDGIIQLSHVSAIKKAWLIEPGLFALSLCVSFRRAEPVACANDHAATEPESSIAPFADR